MCVLYTNTQHSGTDKMPGLPFIKKENICQGGDVTAAVLNMSGFVSEPVLLLAYPGLPCAGARDNPQKKLCLKSRRFICSFVGDAEF